MDQAIASLTNDRFLVLILYLRKIKKFERKN
ncbi:unknow (plasmid) [Vibrio campbellii]|nr:unknow [Vibrio campbellii]